MQIAAYPGWIISQTPSRVVPGLFLRELRYKQRQTSDKVVTKVVFARIVTGVVTGIVSCILLKAVPRTAAASVNLP